MKKKKKKQKKQKNKNKNKNRKRKKKKKKKKKKTKKTLLYSTLLYSLPHAPRSSLFLGEPRGIAEFQRVHGRATGKCSHP